MSPRKNGTQAATRAISMMAQCIALDPGRKSHDTGPMRQGLNELIRWRAQTTPELPALWYEGREWTFRDLDARSNRVADALVRAGVKRGDRVAILDKNSDRYLETVYGIGKAGAVFVPVNWRQAAPEVAYV